MTEHEHEEPRTGGVALIERARELLGSLSADWVAQPAVMERLLATLEALGHPAKPDECDDILLAEVAAQARNHKALREEFMKFTMKLMRDLGRGSLGPGLRRLLETIDLVQSVAGDVFSDDDPPEFITLPKFLALLRQRMNWKAADHARRLSAEKRSESRREAQDVGELNLPANSGDPAAACERADFLDQVLKARAQLSASDQELLRLFMRGLNTLQIAERLELTRDTARKKLSRAMERLSACFESEFEH